MGRLATCCRRALARVGARFAPRSAPRRTARRAARCATLTTTTLLAVGAAGVAGCGAVQQRLPRFSSSLLPPVQPWAADTVTMSGRLLHRVEAPRWELYAQSAHTLAAVEGELEATGARFARHFGPAPRVVVLVLDPPVDARAEFDYAAFVARGVQVLTFVRRPDAVRRGTLGVDEGLLQARLAELYLASYADSVTRALGRGGDAHSTHRALDRLPHWFTEAVVTRVARPDAVEPGLRFAREHRLSLMPLRRLFDMARLGMPTWGELATAGQATRVATGLAAPVGGTGLHTYAPPGRPRHTPPALLAAESTAFGEFLVSRYGPTFLQAVGDALLEGRSTDEALAALPGVPARTALETEWEGWLTRTP